MNATTTTAPVPTTVFGREPERGTFPHLPAAGRWSVDGTKYHFSMGFELQTAPSGQATGATLTGAIVTGPGGGRYTAVHAGGDLFELWHEGRDDKPSRRKRNADGDVVAFRIFRGHIVPASTPTHTFDPNLIAYDRRADIYTGDLILHLNRDGTLSSRVAPMDELAGIHSGHNRHDFLSYSPAWFLPR